MDVNFKSVEYIVRGFHEERINVGFRDYKCRF